METLKLMSANHGNDRVRLEKFDLNLYSVNKRGEFGGGTFAWDYEGGTHRKMNFAVCDAAGAPGRM